MNGRPDQTTLLEVQDHFGLPTPALVEKDWFAIHALAAIHDVEVEGLTLAFGDRPEFSVAFAAVQRLAQHDRDA